MERGSIGESIAWMEAHGHHVYLVLEPWEIDLLRTRFGATDPIAKLDWPRGFVHWIAEGPAEVVAELRRWPQHSLAEEVAAAILHLTPAARFANAL